MLFAYLIASTKVACVLAEPNLDLSIAGLICCLVCSICRALGHVARPKEAQYRRVLSQVSIAAFLLVQNRPYSK